MGRATQFVYLVGGYQILSQVVPMCTTIYNTLYNETPLKERLNTRYGGEGEWALITGSSEGIGKSYALELARAGYNLTICSRSTDKLEKVAEEARNENPNIKTRVVRLDVSSAGGDEYANLFNEQERTTIVVNNAGTLTNKPFFKLEPAIIEGMIKTNVVPYVLMSKYALLHFMRTRDSHTHRNAITFTSSMASCASLANTQVYTGTKTFNAVFANTLRMQAKKHPKLRDLLDVQSLHPAAVSTRLVTRTGGDTVTPDACARGALCDLSANVLMSFGALEHTIIGRTVSQLTGWSPDLNKMVGNSRYADKPSPSQN